MVLRGMVLRDMPFQGMVLHAAWLPWSHARRASLAVIAASLAMAGCSDPRVEASLLRVGSVAPSEWSPGVRVIIRSSHLPHGRPAETVLEGTLYRPGRGPTSHVARFAVRAVTSEQAETVLPPDVFPSGRGTFEGSLTLRFEGPTGASIYGREESVRIDFDDGRQHPTSVSLETIQARWERFGVTLAAAEDEMPNSDFRDTSPAVSAATSLPAPVFNEGWAVASVTGSASDAGLRTGDRLMRVGGTSVRALADLELPGDATAAEVRFERNGLRGGRSLILRAPPPEAGTDWLPLFAVAFLLAAFGLPMRRLRRHFHVWRRGWAAEARVSSLAWSTAGVALGVVLTRADLAVQVSIILAAGIYTLRGWRSCWRHVAAAVFVVIATELAGAERGLLADHWTLVQAPLLLPLFSLAVVQLSAASVDDWRAAPRAMTLALVIAAAGPQGFEQSSAWAATLAYVTIALIALTITAFAVRPSSIRTSPWRVVAWMSATASAAVVPFMLGASHNAEPVLSVGWAPSILLVLLVLGAYVTSAGARVRAPFGA